MFRTRPRPVSPAARQRGATLVMGAIWLSVAVICLAALDIGNLFWQQRQVQKIADLAAVAGADLVNRGCKEAFDAAYSVAVSNGLSGVTDSFVNNQSDVCGNWNLNQATKPANGASPAQYFRSRTNGAVTLNAVRFEVTRQVPYLFAFASTSGARSIAAAATAAQIQPVAALNVRSTLATVDTSKSNLLNALVSGLLGGNVSLTAVSWNGILATQVNLLSFLDSAATRLHLTAGDYSTLLQTSARVGDLLQAAIDAVSRNDATATVALSALQALKAAADISGTSIVLGNLLSIDTATPTSGLDMSINLLDLIRGMVLQTGNGSNAVSAELPVTLGGLASVTTSVRVIEPPRYAIGNPFLAKADPTGPNQIYARTAQVRSLITVSLPGLSGITGLLNAVTNLLAPVTTLLNNVLTLNLGNILCLPSCTATQIKLAPESPLEFSINLDVSPAAAWVTDVNCDSSAGKSLTIASITAAANLRIGQMNAAQKAAVLSSTAIPTTTPIPLLDVETTTCTLGICATPWAKYSRTGLKVDTSVTATAAPHTYTQPPDIGTTTAYWSMSATNLVASLATTLSGLTLATYKYDATKVNSFGNLIDATTQLVSAALGTVQSIVTLLLSPLLDPLVNNLLASLGIDLAKAEVGAQLTCNRGAELVY